MSFRSRLMGLDVVPGARTIEESIQTPARDVTVRYTLPAEWSHKVDFLAVAVAAEWVREGNGPKQGPAYPKRDGNLSMDFVFTLYEAEPYLSGCVCWDGEVFIDFGRETGQFNGPEELEQLTIAMRAIFERCGELIHERGETTVLEGVFKCRPA